MTARAKTKWDEKREASRAALLDAAMCRFHDHGYAVTTIGEIAADAGYTSGAFYFHFKDKAECFWAALEHRIGRRGAWWETVLDGLDPASTPLEEVLARAFAHFSAAEDGRNDWVLAMVDFHQQHRDESEVRARLAEVYERWQGELREFVAALAERGWIAADRRPNLLARQIFAFAEGLQVHARLYAIDPEGAREAMIDGLVRLLR